jgi:hypothetical protein
MRFSGDLCGCYTTLPPAKAWPLSGRTFQEVAVRIGDADEIGAKQAQGAI